MASRTSRRIESALEDSIPSVVPLTEIEEHAPRAGVAYPRTISGWRWLFRVRKERGMEHCFVRVGRRILIDLGAYRETLQQRGKRG